MDLENDGGNQDLGGEKDDTNIGLSVILRCQILRADGTVREEFDAKSVISTGAFNGYE